MKSLRFSILACLACLALLALAGCGDVRESLGLGRSSPDEFAVIDRPPLSMPPDFGLRPSHPGAPRPQEVDPSQHANDALFGSGNNVAKADISASTGAPGASGVEQALLAKSGADKASPDIRNIINAEASQKTDASEHLVQELLWWKKDTAQSEATVVDAPAEAARIKAAQGANTPLNQTATPVIERQSKSGFLGL